MQLNELMKVIISPVDVNLYGEDGFKERIPFEEAKLMMVTCSAIVNYLVSEYGKYGAENA